MSLPARCYAITGASGYIGTRMTRRLLDREPDCHIVAIDIRPPRLTDPRLEFHQLDVRDQRLAALFTEAGVEAVLHFAFVVDPFYDEQEMTDIDLGGTRNVLEAVRRAKVPYLLCTSSTTAYGALADNAVPLTESDPVRATPEFVYAHDKRLMDEMLADFSARHPECPVCVVRPCIVLGPTVSNYIAAALLGLPVAALLDGADPQMQFIHEDDLVDLLTICLERRQRGVYNAVGGGTLSARQLARLQKKRAIAVPSRLVKAVSWLVWRARLLDFALPPGVVDFFRFPWVASGEKARRELGFVPRYSSEDCFRAIQQRKPEVLAAFKAQIKARGRR